MIRAPGVLGESVALFGITYPVFRLFVVLVSVAIGLGLWYLQERTRLGAIIRAGVDDREMVDALGIDIKVVFNRVFVLGGLLAGVAGLLGGALLSLYPGADFEILLLAVVVVMIGGPGRARVTPRRADRPRPPGAAPARRLGVGLGRRHHARVHLEPVLVRRLQEARRDAAVQ